MKTMKKSYEVHLKDEVYYTVEAESLEEARYVALGWWDERMPEHTITECPASAEVAEALSHLRDAIITSGIPNNAEALEALDGVWDNLQGVLDEFDIVL